jgi:hypothetical protein
MLKHRLGREVQESIKRILAQRSKNQNDIADKVVKIELMEMWVSVKAKPPKVSLVEFSSTE